MPRRLSFAEPLGETSTPAAKQRRRQRGVRRRDRDLGADCLERNNGNPKCDKGHGQRKRRWATAHGNYYIVLYTIFPKRNCQPSPILIHHESSRTLRGRRRAPPIIS
eukprot:5353597-Pleurochrysis_carterae.AAC.1